MVKIQLRQTRTVLRNTGARPGWKVLLALLTSFAASTRNAYAAPFALQQGDHICLVGNTLAERMQHDGWLETLWQARFPDKKLVFRNLGFSGDELTIQLRSQDFGSAEDWLSRCQASVILACYGYNESYAGEAGLDPFRRELTQWVRRMRSQPFHPDRTPQVVLISPIPHEDLHNRHLPDGKDNNARLQRYVDAMREVAQAEKVPFVDLFTPMIQEYARAEEPLTLNGIHLKETGNRLVAEIIDETLVGPPTSAYDFDALVPLQRAVKDKNFHWFQRYRTTDGYSIFGGRADLKFTDGQSNRDVMQREMEILDVLTANRDRHIWGVAAGEDVPVNDDNTPPFIPVVSNLPGPLPGGKHRFLSSEKAIERMTVHSQMQINLFASEEQFPELASPVQMAFDPAGRLWVAVWPSYPHWKPKDPLNDKLLIFTDTDADGRADQMQVFADHLQNPTGFEFWGQGVYVAQAPDLLYLEDTDGDGRADIRRRVLHGLDSADTHHTSNSFALGPGGDLYFQEGTFHHTQVETPWRSPVRSANAAVFRLEPWTYRFQVYIAYPFANPHGHVFDAWGQDFVTDGTGNVNYYATPFSGHLEYPHKHGEYFPFFPQRVRPCGGTEILSSRAFPPQFQGNFLNANVIGFQGILQYAIEEDGSGFSGKEQEPIVFSTDPNFRPVDIEIGPDGAIYFVDWQNPIIGHMQHNLRDPNRNHVYGRVYRVRYRGATADKGPRIAGEPVVKLLECLRHPDNRVRHRARIELSKHDSQVVLAATQRWLSQLHESDDDYERCRLEALWVHQQHDSVNEALLSAVLASSEPRARAAATRVLGCWRDRLPKPLSRLRQLVHDPFPRVRLEAVRACSFFQDEEAVEVALEVLRHPRDRFLDYCLGETMRALEPHWLAPLRRGQRLLTANPAALEYLIGQVASPDLLQLPRRGAVCRELLSRELILPADRLSALAELARENHTDVGAEWITSLRRLDRQDGDRTRQVLGELAHLIHLSDEIPQALRTNQDRGKALKQLARQGKQTVTRQAAWAAIANLEPDGDRVWQFAVTSPQSLCDFLRAIPSVRNDAMRAAFQPRILALFGQLPPTVLDQIGNDEADWRSRIEQAGIEALPFTAGDQSALVARLTEFVDQDVHRTEAIRALRRIAVGNWPESSMARIVKNVMAHLESLSAEARTAPDAIDELNLARTLALRLPRSTSQAARKRLDDLGVNVVALRPVPHLMTFDRSEFYVQSGRPTQIVFENSDIMPHNLVIARPGTLLEVGLAADAMAAQPDAYARQFVPDLPAVCFATRLLQPGQSERLTFTAPAESGDYPFVCTFPGHWRRMYGTMHVVASLDDVPLAALASPGEVCAPTRAFVRNWTTAELLPLVADPSIGSPDRGKVLFTELSCAKCHSIGNERPGVGPSLADVAERFAQGEFTRSELVEQILAPSAKVDPKYATTTVLDEDGRIHTGIVQTRTSEALTLLPSPLQEETPITIPVSQIDEEHPSDVSLMPQGLLSTVTASEIADLLRYVESGGLTPTGEDHGTRP